MTTKTSAPKTTATPASPDQGNGLAISSLVLGILSVTGMLFLTGIPAIITGIMSLRKGQKERGMSIAGIVMGSIGTLLSLLILIGFIILVVVMMTGGQSVMPDGPTYDTEFMPVESSRT